MQKLKLKDVFATDLVDQVGALPFDQKNRILRSGWLACELSWENNLELDAGRLTVTLVESDAPRSHPFRGRVGGFSITKTWQMEKACADLIEQAWLHCVVHSRSALKSGFPNRIAVQFSPI